MRSFRSTIHGLALLVAAWASAGAAIAQPADPQADAVGGFATTQIIVQLTPELHARVSATARAEAMLPAIALERSMGAATAATLARFHARGVRPLFAEGFADAELAAELGLDRFYLIETPRGTNVRDMVREMGDHGGDIAAAGLDAIGSTTGIAEPVFPSDAEFDHQWGLHNAGNEANTWVADADIDAPEAWAIHDGTTGGEVIVAVIDSGVDPHFEFGDRLLPGTAFVSGGTDDSEDECNHGTHVAGILAAGGNDGVGVAGVSWGAKILPIDVMGGVPNCGECCGAITDLANGIRWAADNGADIANMSVQFYEIFLDDISLALIRGAADYAEARGVTMIAATGNNQIGGQGAIALPAKLDNVIAVGATAPDDIRPNFSNWGAEIDLVAPGGADGFTQVDRIYSLIGTSSYTYLRGTSMATPHVSGTAALMKSLVPEINSSGIRDILLSTTDDLGPIGWDENFGTGRLNAEAALLATLDWPRLVGSIPPDGAIDARAPFDRNGQNPDGIDSVTLRFPATAPVLGPADFRIRQLGNTATIAPGVASVLETGDETQVELMFDGPISVGAWTIITHLPSNTSVRVGYLPADANGDAVAGAPDITSLIDGLNGVGEPMEIWQLDIDRNGAPGPADIIMLIDLLNGAGVYDPYLNVALP